MQHVGRWRGENDFDEVVAQVSRESGVAVAVVKALIATESGFNAAATKQESGGRYSIGLTQILWPGTARALGYLGEAGSGEDLSGLFDPLTNVRLGVGYLDQQYQQAGEWPGAYSAYNGGWNPDRGFGVPVAQPTTVVVDSLSGRTRTAQVGEYGNQPAVDRFMDNLRYFQGVIGGSGSGIGEPGPSAATLGVLLAGVLGLYWWATRG